MFTSVPPAVAYVDPWLTSYDHRLRQLTARANRIAYVYELPDTSTFRYRAFNPGLSLAADPSLGVSAAWFDLRDFKQDDAFVRLADVLVLCRLRYDAQVARLVSLARAIGMPVLFDCDDFVFDSDRTHLLIDSLAADQSLNTTWDFWFGLVGRYAATYRLCDGFITTNAFLAERSLEVRPDMPVRIMQNYLNPDQQELSERIFAAKRDGGWRRDDQIHIGYFSGSPSHINDFAIVEPALAALMDDDPRIVVRTVGFLEPKGDLLRHAGRIDHHPLQDFINLQRLIGEVEINIAPLQENTFTNCKSELKYFESAICGTVTVATPTSTFRSSMVHGVTGFLSPPFGWAEALASAIVLVENRDAYAVMAKNAYEDVRTRYAWDRQAASIVEAVFGHPACEGRTSSRRAA